ncbi:MAG: ribulose-phosphate 3-epimerase [candidate division KSB1 bacterium]|nr:ribulose-phosphate 3-epimerase [candidate division KSB1 bacterium]MDQ7063217.1 ribulose-phosphate 3-epimerase [candidate division KSB1 bacterium]
MKPSFILAPSILSADFTRLAEEVRRLEKAGAGWLHIDVMDGHFVPNITMGPVVVRALRRRTRLPLDVHLMIADPNRYIDDFVQAGADVLTVHVEACTHLHRTLTAIRSHNVKAGVALNPHTPLSSIEEIVQEVDLVLIMSVNPGFGSQSFIPASMDKIRKLRQMLDERGLPQVRVGVDGGIQLDNIAEVARAGADVLVSGSGIFGTPAPARTVKDMLAQCQNENSFTDGNGRWHSAAELEHYFEDRVFQGAD